MVGREFGHHLGLPGALSGLPSSPLAPGYAGLVAAQRAAGLRHAGEALAPGGGLRVLDGLYVPSGPRARRRVDAALLDGLARAGNAVAGFLAGLHRRDPQAPRRVVLYQLIGLLQDRPEPERVRAATASGVHAEEAAALAAAARLRPVLDRRQRDAAESVADAWERHRLHTVRALLGRIPAGDPAVDALAARAADRLAAAGTAVRAGRRAEDAGDPDTASQEYLRALRTAADDRQALRGLVRVHRPEPGRPAPLRTEPDFAAVELAWPADGADEGWRLLRLYRDERGIPRVREVDATAGAARDGTAALGSAVRYAAFPLRGGRVAGPPLVSHRVLVAPEVAAPVLTDGPGRVDCVWRRPAGAAGVTVEHTGPDGAAGRVSTGSGGFTASGLVTGTHTFRIVCRYDGPGGRPVTSPGVCVTRTVHRWPEPVLTLTARAEGGALRFAWTGARDAEVRLVEWSGETPAPGRELRTAELPPRLAWPERAGALCPPPGVLARVASVAVLGERAITGPALDVEVLHPVTGLTAHRLPDGEARLTLDWPDDADLLRVTWEPLEIPATPPAGASSGPGTPPHPRPALATCDATAPGRLTPGPGTATTLGTRSPASATEPHTAPTVEPAPAPAAGVPVRERIVTAHSYRRTGLRLPVGPGAVRIRVATAPRVAEAVVVVPDAAEAVLPPDAAVGYRLVRPARRFFGRGRTLLRVTLSAPGVFPEAPEFVCVARSGTLRPRDAADGTTVLRIPGTELVRHGTVERELPAAPCPAPYTLRGFLLGEHADAVRLEEPSPATLVVR
ncbi:hypothetical protein [Streptomyces sp. NPDC047000]|uniref:hypothetical protein n=1 Tax=Streptomyces sp. NPDC047000 TaxID=3155474 RepID=UPI0033EEEC5F